MKTYNWEGVNPDGYFLDKLEPIPSGLTPSQLYVFMPPNLGGDRKSGSAGMPRPISYAVFCLKKKKGAIFERNALEAFANASRSKGQPVFVTLHPAETDHPIKALG